MASKIVPINNLTQFGVVKDTPTVGLGPNVFTDAKNIRFRDMAAHKMKGEIDLSSNLNPTFTVDNSASTKGLIKFITHWPNPNKDYYVYVIQAINNDGTTYNRVIARDCLAPHTELDITPEVGTSNRGFSDTGYWQSTNFAGGFCLILNNGVDEPQYILDTVNNTSGISGLTTLTKLPGWDSYNAAQKVLEVTYKAKYGTTAVTNVDNAGLFDLGVLVDFSTSVLHVSKQTPGETSTEVGLVAAIGATGSGSLGTENFVPGALPDPVPARPTGTATTFSYCVYNSKAGGKGTTLINLSRLTGSSAPFEDVFKTGDVITVNVVSRNPVKTTCGVIRSFNNILVAGNLKEQNTVDNTNIVRKLTGVVRTSDVAAPGGLPQNWNPFAGGANTADEFTLSDTSVIQDLVPLSGNMYIYTTDSIHAARLTGNALAPVSFSPVTKQYGCQTTDGVIEFDGKHLVVGSNDIYLFSGNPGNITSISDARVRDYFYKNYNAASINSLFILRNQANDEIWINYPKGTNTKCTEALIYNYKLNNWTIRDLDNIVSGVIAPVKGNSDDDRPWASGVLSKSKLFPVMARATSNANNSILVGDIGYQFTGSNYVSYLEREGLSVTPEFYTESFNSIALLTQGRGILRVTSVSSNAPGGAKDIDFDAVISTSVKKGVLRISSNDSLNNQAGPEYKSDCRISGRFINYRIDDANPATNADGNFVNNNSSTSTSWNLSGIQMEVTDGGTR